MLGKWVQNEGNNLLTKGGKVQYLRTFDGKGEGGSGRVRHPQEAGERWSNCDRVIRWSPYLCHSREAQHYLLLLSYTYCRYGNNRCYLQELFCLQSRWWLPLELPQY